MEHQVFKNWLLHLRSGNYTQIRERFYGTKTGEACALGVFGITIRDKSKYVLYPNMDGLPHGRRIWEAISVDGIPTNIDEGTILGLDIVHLNDNERKSLPEIADMLEKAYYEWRANETPVVQEMVASAP